jgi:hypothetical protein
MTFIYYPILSIKSGIFHINDLAALLRTGKEIRFRFWLSEDKAGKEAKRRPTGW